MPALNRQPVFTDIPILVSQTFDPPLVGSSGYAMGSIPPASIFTSGDDFGSLIERITVSATGDLSNGIVSAKLIYLAIYDNNIGSWNLYKTAAMPYTEVSPTVPNPEVEWVFTGGILLPKNFQLGIAATENFNNSGRKGDILSVTVEGSSYTSV